MNNVRFVEEISSESVKDLSLHLQRQIEARIRFMAPDRRLAVSSAHSDGDRTVVELREIGEDDDPPAIPGVDWTIFLPLPHLVFTYTNHNGVTSRREVVSPTVYFGITDYYPDMQWLMRAFDLERQGERIFALANASEFVGA